MVLPIFVAWLVAMMLKPLVRWLSCCRLRPPVAAAVVLSLLLTAIGAGVFHLGRPAMPWMNDAPEHVTGLRQRVQRIFSRLDRINPAVRERVTS